MTGNARMISHIRYIFPRMTDFRETRPVVCWEHMYGWIDGYGLFFDPVILNSTRLVPEWENGWNGKRERGDFVIACCHQAAEAIGRPPCAGIYIRPARGPKILERGRASEKERLVTSAGEYFYPSRLPFDRYAGEVAGGWQIGEDPALARVGDALAVGFEFFAMLMAWNGDWPERRLLEGAHILRGMLAAAGAVPRRQSAAPSDPALTNLRLDFQAYGVNRLMMQWFLDLKGEPRGAVSAADRAILRGAAAWARGDAAATQAALTTAFAALADLRRRHSQLDLHFLEFPHIGLLLPDRGYFELEWPEASRETMLDYLEHVRERGYRLSIEGGGNCWQNLTTRFPDLGRRLKEAWQRGDIDLTNGTQTLPLALFSPLALQYWQFRTGRDSFRKIFGRDVKTYQCQESSLTPQLPELLLHFGYARALHIAHNRGAAPGEDTDFIWWQSPGGHRLPAMAARHPKLSHKGNNYFHDLPLIHDEYGRQAQTMHYVNFMDLGFVPYRVHQIRAHQYAPVWGRFGLAEPRFAAAFDSAAAPIRTYLADDYKVSPSAFYPNETNVNALSQHELIFGLAHRLRQTQILSFVSGQWPRQRRRLESVMPALLVAEAHDAVLVQGQRVGEGHAGRTMVTPPYSRTTLATDIAVIERSVRTAFDGVRAALPGTRGRGLYNAAEVTLPFARVVGAPAMAKGVIAVGAHRYAVGPFKPFTRRTAATAPSGWSAVELPCQAGRWRLTLNGEGRLLLRYGQRGVCIVPRDSTHGTFETVRVTASRCGGLHRLEVLYRASIAGCQQVANLTVLLTPDSPLAEITVSYAPGRAFDVRNRWADNLALELDAGHELDRLVRFNPNVYSETAEDRIASPYCLTAVTKEGPLTLLNEGAFYYQADRSAGKLEWLFHVANETVHERRLALLLGEVSDPFQLARAWSQGVTPAERPVRAWPAPSGGWEGLSVETLTDARTLLVSNLSSEPRSFVFLAGDIRRGMDAEGHNRLRPARGRHVELELQPYELSFLRLTQGE